MMEPIPTTCVAAEPFALQVTDDSMAPEFWEGCIILVDPTGHARDGTFVLAEFDERYLFRTLRVDVGGSRLVPLNDRYPSVPLPGGLARVRGVVVQRAGTRRRHHKRYD